MSKPVVLCDVDGVVANYTQMYIACMYVATGHSKPPGWEPSSWDIEESVGLSTQELSKVRTVLNASGIANNMLPLPGAQSGVAALAKSSDLYFVTSPMRSSPTWVFDRTQWLTRYFGKEVGERAVHTHYKYRVYGDFLYDDKPEHCRKWQEAFPGGLAVCAPHEYNKHEKDLVFATWAELLMLVEMRAKGARREDLQFLLMAQRV